RKTGCEQEKDAGSQEIGSDIDQAEIRSAHRPSCCVTTVATHPERYGSSTCWRPFSLRSFNELAVPLDCRTTYVSFVPVGPAKLNPEVGSEAPILTDGRPRSVISRRSTVSDCSSPEEDLLAGRTVILARMRPCGSTISRARPRKTGSSCWASAGRNCCARASARSARFKTITAYRLGRVFIWTASHTRKGLESRMVKWRTALGIDLRDKPYRQSSQGRLVQDDEDPRPHKSPEQHQAPGDNQVLVNRETGQHPLPRLC